MKIRGHGNGLAIALSAVAVVFAASGTAYAVTATTVNIADPSTPSRVAHVDTSGRLTTIDATSTVNITQSVFANASHDIDVFSTPTTATMAVSKFSVTALTALSGTWNSYLYQVPLNADGTCSTSLAVRPLGYGTVLPGSLGGQDYAAPIIVTPAGGAKYCLDVYVSLTSGTASGGEAFGVQLAAFASVGKYSGAGVTAAGPAEVVPKSVLVRGR